MRIIFLNFMIMFLLLTYVDAEEKPPLKYNNIYFDHGTNLMWQDSPDIAKISKGWLNSAVTYCQNVRLGGFTDWKLPTAKEYRSLSINDAYKHLQYIVVGDFWTSDLQKNHEKEIESVWILYFDSTGKPQSSMSRDKGSLSHVRCVRESLVKSKIDKAVRYIEINNILYQNEYFSFSNPQRIATWEESKHYCSKLEIDGYKKWRLPTSGELEKIFRVDIMYALGDYNNFDDYSKQFLNKVKTFVEKIKNKRIKSYRGSELLVKDEFVENMPLVNEKYPLGEFWTNDERDSEYSMTLDVRHGVAWWGYKKRKINTLCVRDKIE